MMESRQQRDLELWHKWKKSNRQADLDVLLTRLQPLVHREVAKWQASAPPAVLESKGRELVVDALDSYNPNRGAAIGTHITSRLRKLSRSVYPQQNIVRLPENKQLMYHAYNTAHTELTERHGREPSDTEMSDYTGWNSRKVKTLTRDFGRRQITESEGIYNETDMDADSTVHFYHHGLPHTEQRLFEDITGYGGRTAMSNTQLMKSHRISQGQLSHQKSKFVKGLRLAQSGKY